MKRFVVPGLAALIVTVGPASAFAQAPSANRLTPDELAVVAKEMGAVLRPRQLAEALTLPKGQVDIGVQVSSTPLDKAAGDWDLTRLVARFGAGSRVEIGAWGGYSSKMRDGMLGIDAKIALLRQGDSMPVSVSIRPSLSSMLGAGDVWAGTVGADLSISRSFGAFAPYAGVAAMSSMAADRLDDLDFDRISSSQTLAYAGIAYNWRSVIAAVEVEKGTRVSYAMRLGRRF